MFQKGLFIDEPKVNLEVRRQGIMEPSHIVTGTITPTSNLRTLIIPDLIDKDNFIIHPITNITAEIMATRVHYGGYQINNLTANKTYCASTNTGQNSWTWAGTNTYSSSTGSIAIATSAGSNGGGYWRAGVTYYYVGWSIDKPIKARDMVIGTYIPSTDSLTATIQDLKGRNCALIIRNKSWESAGKVLLTRVLIHSNRVILGCGAKAAENTNGQSSALSCATGSINPITFNSATGKITSTNNYAGGGYFIADVPYYYIAWNV